MNGCHIYRPSQLFVVRVSRTFAEALTAQTENRDNVIKDCANLSMFMSKIFWSRSSYLVNFSYRGKHAGD